MINTKYANAYKEVLAVLNNLVKEDYENNNFRRKIKISKIKAFRTSYYNNLEEEKRQKYNPDDIFRKEDNIAQEKPQSVELIEYKKESFFVRFINWIKSIFKIW